MIRLTSGGGLGCSWTGGRQRSCRNTGRQLQSAGRAKRGRRRTGGSAGDPAVRAGRIVSLIGFRGSPPAPIAQPVTPPTQASMHQPFSTTHVPWRARLPWLPGTRNRRFRRLERSQPVPSTGKPIGELGTAVLFESGTTSSNPVFLQRRVRNEPDPLAAGTPVNTPIGSVPPGYPSPSVQIQSDDSVHPLEGGQACGIEPTECESSVCF